MLRSSVAAFVAATLGGGIGARAGDLPIPCVAGSCGSAAFVTSGNASAVASGNTMRIDQRSDKAILNWSSFNVGADSKVQFNQPGAASVALNRIHSQSPSQILGAVEANGQVYLVNPNGIVFGAGSRVKTAGLIASTLNISDDNFNSGLLAPELLQKGRAALEAGPPVYQKDADGNPLLDKDGNPIEVPIKLIVQQGAELTTQGTGQRILLAGQNVENSGKITTPLGQTIIAAGEKVYLQASTDPNLRGLLVEVDKGGTAWNRLTGDISAAQGNVTLVGLAVNQDGRLSATTTVNANGSIRLLARQTVSIGGSSGSSSGITISAKEGGTLNIGSGSNTTVLPELTDTATAVDDQTQPLSSVELSGKKVFIQSNAAIVAPGGKVSLSAAAVPGTVGTFAGDAEIRVHSGAIIDVSGTRATAPVTRNLVTVELRANELSDSPLQRDGVIRGQPLIVDARVGTPLGDVSGALKTIARTVGERTAAGGTVSFASDGDVMINSGAIVDVSGGRVDYTPGVIQTTQLIGANGRLYDVGSAPKDIVYTGIVNPTSKVSYDRWGVTKTVNGPSIGHYDPGYTEGRNGGTLSIMAPVMSLAGDLRGSVFTGTLQRDPAKMPLGALLQIGDPTGNGQPTPDYRAPSVSFVNSPTPLVALDGASMGGPSSTLELPLNYLARGGFARTAIYSNGTIEVALPDPLRLQPGSSFSLVAHRVDVRSDIIAPSATVSLTASEGFGIPGVELVDRGIGIGSGVTIDVRGTWTNDQLAVLKGANASQLASAVFKDGGKIQLSTSWVNGGKGVDVGDGVNLLASGGAWLTTSGSLKGGKGGEISILSGLPDSTLTVGENTHLEAFGVNGAAGGSFKVEAPRIDIANGTAWAMPAERDHPVFALALSDAEPPRVPSKPVLTLGSALFSDYGFSTFTINATSLIEPDQSTKGLSILAGTTLAPVVRTLLIDPSANRNALTGGPIAAFSSLYTPLDGLRSPVSMTFAVVDPRRFNTIADPHFTGIDFAVGASIHADPGSTVKFAGLGGVRIGGEISAPGGTISGRVGIPNDQLDAGFDPSLGIDVLSSARLDVSGVRTLLPNDTGLLTGSVLGGGTIELIADRGSVSVRAGARLFADGASGLLDMPNLSNPSAGYTRSLVGSAGGTIAVRAPESILLAGDMSARAGASDTLASAGGTLSVQLTRDRGFGAGANRDSFPTNDRVLQITDGQTIVGTRAPNGLGAVDARKIAAGGFDSVTLEGGSRIEIDPTVSLHLARQLSLDSPEVFVRGDGNVSLSAAYVSFGHTVQALTQPVSSSGAGTLTIAGDLIDITGSTAVSGVASVVFSSTGDIRLRGLETSGTSRGDLSSTGDITLRAGRLYPTTGTAFSIQSSGGTTNVVKIEQVGTSPGVPLSAAGSVSIQATDIVQAGTLLAPFGQISLTATNSVTFAPGSVTSVSAGSTTIPFGTIVLGDWRYTLGAQDLSQTAIPGGQISVDASEVDMQAGSTIDLRGGGDLYAYEWVPGTGGTRDALAAGQNPNLYVVFPSMRGQSGVYDPMDYAGSGIGAGDTVYLGGSDSLPAGVYPLLPARYALLPGAVLVEARPDFSVMAAGTTSRLADGATVVAGRHTFLNTGIGDSVYSGFAIRDGSYGRQLATYNDYKASTFFPALAARLDLARAAIPADAAALSLNIGTSLVARGTVQAAGATGGLGASIDISAPKLEILGTGGGIDSEAVQVQASDIEKWNPARLLLGARRSSDGSSMDLVSDSIHVGEGVSLVNDEVMLAARDEIRLEAGARVASRSSTSTRDKDPHFATTFSKVALTGDGAKGAAVLAVSDVSRLQITRPDDQPEPDFPGSLFVEPNATVSSRSALLVDAPGGGRLEGTLDGVGASWDVVSSKLSFTDTPADLGLAVTPNVARALGQGYNARLASGSTIDFYGSIGFGAGVQAGATLTDLTLVASGIQSIGTGNNVSLGAARNLTFEGVAIGDPTFESGSGSLNVKAQEITLGPGSLSIAGFRNVLLDASADVRSDGTGKLQVAGALTLTTPLLTASTGANLSILSADSVSIQSRAASTGAAMEPAGLGASLAIEAPSIDLGATILQPSGLVMLKATGAGASLNIDAGAVIDVGGTLVKVLDRQVMSPAGAINLISDGTLTADAGATLNVAAGQSNGGSILVRSNDLTTLDAVLHGGTDASFDLFAGSLSDFASLNRRLESNGFTGRRNVRVSSGDLVLGTGDSITARSVNLTADAGQVNVFGTINAKSDNERSSISLFGTQGVLLGAGGALHADGVGEDSRGGVITLGTTAGVVNLASGSTISTSGDAEKGRVEIRAPGTANNYGLAPIGAVFKDVSQLNIESYLAFNDTPATLNQSAFDGYAQNVANYFATAAQGIRNVVGSPRGVALSIRPGLELTYDGDLRVSSINLNDTRLGGQPLNLSVRATGSISTTTNAVVSDGFVIDSTSSPARTEMQAGPSASLKFAAGGDLTSADPLALARGATGDFKIATGTLLRTTTGDLSIAAAHDIHYIGRAAVYTAGNQGLETDNRDRGPSFGYPTGGGQLSMSAGNDILGFAITSAVGDWQPRAGKPASGGTDDIPTQWGVDVGRFNWNAGSLGGGDVSMRAGHDVLNVSVAAADSGKVMPDGSLEQFGGGVLGIEAGNDISSLYAHITHGINLIHAGGALGKVRQATIAGASRLVGSLFSMENAALDIVARDGIAIETVFNPTVIAQAGAATSVRSFFFTYGGKSSVDAVSAAGDVTFSPTAGGQASAQAYMGTAANNTALAILPPTVRLGALGGDVRLSGTGTLYASDNGQLDILASNDIIGAGSTLMMSDLASGDAPTVFAPQGTYNPTTINVTGGQHGSSRHLNDSVPALITAGRDIVYAIFTLSKEANIRAGRDFVDLSVLGQNLRATDVTSAWAGRDIRYTAASGTAGLLQLGGPGSFAVLAGRDVDLGFSAGITTIGATLNTSLPGGGADVSVIAGYGPGMHIDNLVSNVVDKSDDYKKALVAFISSLSPDAPTPSYDTARSQFLLMDTPTQLSFVSKVFFSELVKSGREVNADPKLGFDRGYAAIDALFPGSRPGEHDPASAYAGDILLTFSRVYTISGGTISLFAPGGLLNVGLANPPKDIPDRKPSDLGIVAQRAGDVRVFTASDVLVNASRIFTLGGGDIAVWSTLGDIDAGRGAKSAISAPPPIITVDSLGNVNVDFGAAVAGSGIRTIVVGDAKPGNVDLIAPAGIVNAGDAGIGAAGNLNVAAQQVVGLDNIQVGGSSSGVPAETSSLGASLSGASSASTSASSSSSAAVEARRDSGGPAPLADSALGWLDVFVEGFGDEACKPTDEQCLQRNRKSP